MRPPHISGADQLGFAEEAIDPDRFPVADDDEKKTHDQKSANETQHRRAEHGDDDFGPESVADEMAGFWVNLGHGPDDDVPVILRRGQRSTQQPADKRMA